MNNFLPFLQTLLQSFNTEDIKTGYGNGYPSGFDVLWKKNMLTTISNLRNLQKISAGNHNGRANSKIEYCPLSKLAGPLCFQADISVDGAS